jgi:thiol-disulfide isomerase/thioredoxin
MKFNKKSQVIELTPENYDIKNKKITHPMLVNKKGMIAYLSENCGYCVRFAPVYEKVANTLGNSFIMCYLDCAKYGEFAYTKLNVRGYPTVLYIDRNGKPYKKYEGERTENAMIEDICKECKVCSRI